MSLKPAFTAAPIGIATCRPQSRASRPLQIHPPGEPSRCLHAFWLHLQLFWPRGSQLRKTGRAGAVPRADGTVTDKGFPLTWSAQKEREVEVRTHRQRSFVACGQQRTGVRDRLC